MKTFESCNRVWLTMPEVQQQPLGSDCWVRVLFNSEMKRPRSYQGIVVPAQTDAWQRRAFAGWYPVHQDGTDDQETAKLFATGPLFTPRPPRPRIIRRRFKLSTKRSILP